MTKRAAAGRQRYLVTVVPGLEALARDEIERRLSAVRDVEVRTGFDRRSGLIAFGSSSPAREMLQLQLSEDVFSLIAEERDVPATVRGPKVIRDAVSSSRGWDAALSEFHELRGPGRGPRSFRVIARKSGRQAYRRVDVRDAVEAAVGRRFRRWQVAEDAPLELWASVVDGYAAVGVRLSDRSMRQHGGQRVSLPASLKATVAHAMVSLSQPREDDVFIDPMCGSGTIALERARCAPARATLASDVGGGAVAAARANRDGEPIEVLRADARALPLADGAVSALVSNLPFGRQVGAGSAIDRLYRALMQEWGRVLATEGLMVLLVSNPRLLASAAREAGFAVERRVPVILRGLDAAIVVLHRQAAAEG